MLQKDIYYLSETLPFILKPYQELRFDLKLDPIPKPSGCVQGWVRPYVKACVKAFDLYLNPIEHTYTDPHGRYILHLPAGFYYIGAVAPSYRLSSLTKIRIVPKSCQQVNFWLSRLNILGTPFS